MAEAKKRKSRAARRWYTVAYFTREGVPHPAHLSSNFTRVFGQLPVHLETLVRVMSTESIRRGAYVAAVWAGELSEHDAVHGPQKPLLYVYEGGRVERIGRRSRPEMLKRTRSSLLRAYLTELTEFANGEHFRG
jgi:hypothetical protein